MVGEMVYHRANVEDWDRNPAGCEFEFSILRAESMPMAWRQGSQEKDGQEAKSRSLHCSIQTTAEA